MRLTVIVALIAASLVGLSLAGDSARAITGPMGVIETYMGTGVAGNTGDGGASIDATIDGPGGIAFAPNGDLYVASGCILRKVHEGVVSTAADACTYFPSDPSLRITGVAVSPAGEAHFGLIGSNISGLVMKATDGSPAVAVSAA